MSLIEVRSAAENKLFEQYSGDIPDSEIGSKIVSHTALEDYSIASAVRDHARDKSYLKRLHRIDTRGLSEQDRLSHAMLLRELEDHVRSFKLKQYEMPVTQMAGPHLSFAELPKSSAFKETKDYEDYLTQLREIPRAFAQTIAVLKRGEKDGLMPPKVLLVQIPAQCEGTIQEDPFLTPVEHFPGTVSQADQQRLQREIRDAVHSLVLPAYAGFAAFVANDYAPHGRDVIGLVGLRDGARQYQFAIQHYTTTNMTAEEIHLLGLREVSRVEALLNQVAHRAGYADLNRFRNALKEDPRYIPRSPDQIVDTFRADVTQMQPHLAELFLPYSLPPLTVEPVPASQPGNGTHYVGGSSDGRVPARIVVLTSDYAHRSLISDETQAYHEGIPGHHLQISVQQQLTALPHFRRDTDYAVFAEGWAVYAEALGKEIGFFQEPASDYGRLNLELMRAVRLVVDTGIHAKGWSRKQAIEYYRQSGATDEPTTQSEVDMCIARPGRNLAYQIGKLRILELRHHAEERLGARFDLREFHDQILRGGNMPLDLLAKQVDAWISQKMG